MTDTSDSLAIICNSPDKTFGIGIFSPVTGTLGPLQTLPFPDVAGKNAGSPIALDPGRRILYLGFRGAPPAVLSFRIDYARPGLDYLGRAPLPDSMAYIAADMTGRYLFSAAYGGGKFAVNRIRPDGVAGDILEVLDPGPKAHCTVVSPDNRLVFVTSVGTELILRYAFDAETGRLERTPRPAAALPPGTGPRHMVLHPGGRFAYVVNQTSGTVDAFALNAAGDLAHLQSADVTAPGFGGEPLAADIHLTPDGTRLYASDRASNTITGFAVDGATGRLAETGHTAAPDTPRGFAIDPSGRYLVSLAENAALAAVFAIDPSSGALRQHGEYPTGNGPNWIEMLPLAGAARPA